MDGAAGGGHLHVVRWLATNRSEGCSQAAFDMAAAEGHLHVMKVWKRRPLCALSTHPRAYALGLCSYSVCGDGVTVWGVRTRW